jgi:hypothetical protein
MPVDSGQLIGEIKDAFRGTEPPSAAALMNNHCEECAETSWAFSQKGWEDLASDVGSYQETALLTPDAWRYYLPTIMIWCLRDTDVVDALVDNTANQLTPPSVPYTEWFERRRHGFTDSQRRVIASFLEWCYEQWSAHDPSREAHTYWSRSGDAG